MSGIYGFTRPSENPGIARAMARAVGGNGSASTIAAIGVPVTIGAAGLRQQASIFSDDRLIVAVSSTQGCGLSPPRTEAVDTARLLADAYRSRGSEAISSLSGGFALAIADRLERTVILAVDKMGVCPLTWTLQEGELIFGSKLDAVLAHPSFRADIDSQSIFDYCYFQVIPGPRTIYRGVSRLLPGQALRFHAGNTEVFRHFAPAFREDVRRPLKELEVEFLEILANSIDRARGPGPTGTFLSGGTDSSTVTGLLARASDEPVHAFSIGFSVPEYDESSYARTAARHFKVEHHEYVVTPEDVEAAIPLIARTFDQPFGNASAVPAYICARIAREHGIARMLAGDGGDELFGGNTRYATQQFLSWYGNLPAPLRLNVLEPLASHIRSGRKFPPLRKLCRYIELAKVPMPDRGEQYNLISSLGAANVFGASLLAGVDQGAPLALVRKIYQEETGARSLINRMLAFDFRLTLFDSDLPKVNGACDLAGIEVAYPMLDDDLLDFSLRLDPRLKLRGTSLRYFFKRALRDLLPQEILRKKKHGFGLPFGVWLQSQPRLKALAADSLAGLRARGIIDPAIANDLLGSHLDLHAGYYGTLVWILVMLEQWLRAHETTAAELPVLTV